jgi:hypothetical protein
VPKAGWGVICTVPDGCTGPAWGACPADITLVVSVSPFWGWSGQTTVPSMVVSSDSVAPLRVIVARHDNWVTRAPGPVAPAGTGTWYGRGRVTTTVMEPNQRVCGPGVAADTTPLSQAAMAPLAAYRAAGPGACAAPVPALAGPTARAAITSMMAALCCAFMSASVLWDP